MRYFGDPSEKESSSVMQLLYSVAVVGVLAAVLILGGCQYIPEAKELFQDKTGLGPEPTDQALAVKSYEEIQRGDYTTAEIYLDAALQINPTNALALYNLGQVYEYTGRKEEARSIYAGLIRLASQEVPEETQFERDKGKSVTQLAGEALARFDRKILAEAARTTTNPLHAPVQQPLHDLESDWRPRMEERIAMLKELEARGFLSGDELLARIGGAWLKSQSEATPAAAGVIDRLQMLDSFHKRGLLTPIAYASERAEVLDTLAPVQAMPDSVALNEMAQRENANFVSPAKVTTAPMSQHTETHASDGHTHMESHADASSHMNGTAVDLSLPKNSTRVASAPHEPDVIASVVPHDDHVIRVHLASYRSEGAAKKAWANLQRLHGDLLGGLSPDFKKVDLGTGKGVFFRVTAGPLDSTGTAKGLCSQLRARKLYCTPSG